MDISGYHHINLAYGEETGDRILEQFAARLLKVCRHKDHLARIGSDQFAILLTGILGKEHVLLAADKIDRLMSEPFEVDGNEILLRLNMGISLLSQFEGDPGRLFSGALKAVHHAKDTNENLVIFGENVSIRDNHYGALLSEFNRALANGELELEYQAKQQFSPEHICGAEALLRWHHPTRGTIPPELAVELAEKSGCSDALSYWVIDQALRCCSRWLEKGAPIAVSVNLEAHNLNNPQLSAYISEALELWRVESRFLIIEVTEAALMKQIGQVPVTIDQVLDIGVRISIDDFGTGYSSLAYLNNVNVHELKIDKSFVDRIESTSRDVKLVETIINLGRSLDLKVTAEGVESSGQYQMLKEMGCDIAQGYHISRPLPPDQFIDTFAKKV